MPYGMPAMMMKGPVFAALDELLNRRRWSRRSWLQCIHDKLMNDSTRIADLLVDEGVIKAGEPADAHIRLHWFPDDITSPKTWWKHVQPIEARTRIGYANAIRANIERRRLVPFDSYWFCVNEWNEPDDDEKKQKEHDNDRDEYFQIYHTVNDRQMTVLIVTPGEVHDPEAPRLDRDPEAMFLTRHKLSTLPDGLVFIRSKQVNADEVTLYQIHPVSKRVLFPPP
jgi:hypothetical protein